MADKLTLSKYEMKDRSTSHLRIYVGNLTEQATVDSLYDHFIQYGQINGIIINKGFGFVQFDTETSAQNAISKAGGTMFQGKPLNVKASQTNPEKMKRPTEIETVTIQQEVQPAVAISDNYPAVGEDLDDQYDSYGNYIGDADPYPEEFPSEDYDDSYAKARKDNRGGRARGVGPRGMSRGLDRGMDRGRGRGLRGRGRADWGYDGFDRYAPVEYPRPVPVSERNDCEIIVVSKQLTEYAEYIESRLKRLSIVVDLLFPNEDVPIGRVLGNIASRGCLYAILVTPQNKEHRSLTLTILHGLPQEHRNMPLEDALVLISRNFQEVQRGGAGGREAVYALLGQLADGRTLTVLQYDKVIEYVQERRQQQVKVELGETTPAPTKTQTELQQRILSILNEKKAAPPAPVAAPPPQPPAPAPAPANKLLNDPTVRKALDSILHKINI